MITIVLKQFLSSSMGFTVVQKLQYYLL